jgi:hypothetical protein
MTSTQPPQWAGGPVTSDLAPGCGLKIAPTATGNFGIAHGERADVCLKSMVPIREQIAPAETR